MSDIKTKKKSNNFIPNIVFFATIAVVFPSILSIMFPAFLVSFTTYMPEKSVDPFELGIEAIPFLSVNLILLGGIGLLYYTGNIPSSVQRFTKFVFDFEVSRKVSLIVVLVLLALFTVVGIEELTEPDEWTDFGNTKMVLETWPIHNLYKVGSYNYHVQNFLLYTSEKVFDNIRIVPFISSIALVLLTYLFTVEITKKRFAGLIAMTILLQSSNFLRYDTTATYTNFWTMFYLLSLYMIIKKWQFSSFCYLLSVLSKPLTLLFFPMTLFFIYRINLVRMNKIYIAISFAALFGIGLVAILLFDISLIKYLPSNFSLAKFWQGFGPLGIDFRYDGIFIHFLLPLLIGLFVVSRRGIKQADAIMFLILGVLLSAPLTSFFGPDVFPYRFIPYIVFFSIGAGTILSKKLTNGYEKSP